ncbi:MAG: hypothetical protein GC165_17275 [Armatimonadetes bacterium]|nr:hypothetical protein [Armatimonadota bacterium]
MLGIVGLVCAFGTTLRGHVTVAGKDTGILRLVLFQRTAKPEAVAETIAGDGTYSLHGNAVPSNSLFVTVPVTDAGYVGGPWVAAKTSDALDIHAFRLSGKSILLTPDDCSKVLLSMAETCALQLDGRARIPGAVVLNGRIALDREATEPDRDILTRTVAKAHDSTVDGADDWMRKIARAIERDDDPLPNYRTLEPEKAIERLSKLTGDEALCEGMLDLSFAAEEFGDWVPAAICPLFSKSVGVEGEQPGHVSFQIACASESGSPLSPPLLFRRDVGVTKEELGDWAAKSPTARLYLFRLAVSLLAKDDVVRERAATLLRGFQPRLRIYL